MASFSHLIFQFTTVSRSIPTQKKNKVENSRWLRRLYVATLEQKKNMLSMLEKIKYELITLFLTSSTHFEEIETQTKSLWS